jgi:hypothetical protein
MTLHEYLKYPTDYELGVKFYNAHFGDGKWQKKYRGNPTAKFLMANLIYALQKVVAAGKNIEVEVERGIVITHSSKPLPSPIAKKIIEAVYYEPTPQPIIYTSDRAGKELEARNLYGRAGKRREDLFSDDSEVRRLAALSIKEDMRRNRELWVELNYFDKNGSWPTKDTAVVEVDIETMTVQELLSLKKNLAPWCSKEKPKIANEKDADKKAKRIKILEQKQELLKRVNSKLEAI